MPGHRSRGERAHLVRRASARTGAGTPLLAVSVASSLAAAVGLVAAGSVGAQSAPLSYRDVSQAELLDPAPGEWLMWRRTYDQQGHSPLRQIDRSNVADLGLAWAWTLAPGKQELTPLVRDGVMFLVQACDQVDALDARDGSFLWSYRRPRVEHPAIHACAVRNAALYGGNLYLGTHDAFLVALDARDGSVVWERAVGDWTIGHHYSGGPQVIEGRVVAGMSGCYHINTRCWISAHDPESGEELWRTYTIPAPGEPGSGTWNGTPAEERRGGSVWMAPGYDAETGLIYAGVAVAVPWGSVQKGTSDGDILYTNSTVALDPATGEIVWYFQHLPGDEWDQDHAFERVVVETTVAPDPTAVTWMDSTLVPGARRKVLTGVPGKPGIVWTLDARTGDFLWARETGYQNVVVGVDVASRKGIANPELRFLPIGEERIVCPHLSGGMLYQSVSYSPRTNALYVPANDTCMRYTLNEVRPTLGLHHGSASFPRVPVPGSDGLVGRLVAIDVETGRTLWEHRQRAGIGGSVLTTAGDLVFVADDARRFRAFDAETGEVLWERTLNSSAGGYPVSYMVDGVQYVAIGAGGGPNYRSITPEIRQAPGGNVLWVFRLR